MKKTETQINMDALKWVFKLEHVKKDRSGIYGYTQRTMAYNSNRIEGSTLTEDQTAALFEEGYLPATDEFYKSKDIEEMTGHFLMFNKMISCLGQELSEDMIKSFHYELKAGVFEDRANGYAIGDYKKRTNTVGGLKVTSPDAVGKAMKELLAWYNGQKKVTVDTLAEFHSRYELIHPFQDGNGRTGRMILFKECLEHDIMPFIIHNENRIKYVSSLREAQTTGDYSKLIQYFKEEQKDYAKQCELFGIYERYQNAKSSKKEKSAEALEDEVPPRKSVLDKLYQNQEIINGKLSEVPHVINNREQIK